MSRGFKSLFLRQKKSIGIFVPVLFLFSDTPHAKIPELPPGFSLFAMLFCGVDGDGVKHAACVQIERLVFGRVFRKLEQQVRHNGAA